MLYGRVHDVTAAAPCTKGVELVFEYRKRRSIGIEGINAIKERFTRPCLVTSFPGQ